MAQDLKKMTKAALESLGRQFGIELDRRLTKDKLIKQVKKAQKNAEKVEKPKVEEVATKNEPEWKQYFTDAREDTSGRWTVRTHRGRIETGFLNIADAIQWHKENE